MKPTTVLLQAALLAAVALPAAQAQDKKQAIESYKQMCLQSVDMGKPFGEYDLKGNPKLDAYCGCFGEGFVDHLLKTKPKIGDEMTPDQATKRDLAIRNACRGKMGLPLAK